MNDPHVVALLYRVNHGEYIDYSEAQPLVLDEPAFRLEVKDNQARFELKEHYAAAKDARKAIEDYIHTWEFDACLENGADSFRLEFHKAEIKDRNPTPGVIHYNISLSSAHGTAMPPIIKYPYPSPPSGIRINADVQTMFDRYMNHRRGGEPLPGAAYFCLTMLEYIAEKIKQNQEPNRKAASRYFQIDIKVLRKIGRLSSTKGGPTGARKGEGVPDDLTNKESRFLEEAIKKMIRRAAEKAYSPSVNFSKISFSDLPSACNEAPARSTLLQRPPPKTRLPCFTPGAGAAPATSACRACRRRSSAHRHSRSSLGR